MIVIANYFSRVAIVTVNHYNNSLYLLDDFGIIMCNYDNHQNSRVFQFPPYKHKLLSTVVYSTYYNVYFVLTACGKVKVRIHIHKVRP